MKKMILFVVLSAFFGTLCFASGVGVRGVGMNIGVVPAAGYLWECDFEGNASTTDGDPAACGLTMVETDDWNDDDTTEVLEGSETLLVSGSSRGYKTVTGSDDPRFLAFMFQEETYSANAVLWELQQADGTCLLRFYAKSGYIQINHSACGTGVATTSSKVEGTTYYYQIMYDNGTGSDGVIKWWHSANGTDWVEGSPDTSITNSSDTAQIGRIEIGSTTSYGDYFFDDIIYSDSFITW